ncbi:MAG: amino acid permease [Candidatus Babeliaceae bacterium]|jgi:amino acid transporter
MTQAHKISLPMATIIGINAMIGAGIFGVPAALLTSVGPAGIITYAFVIIAVLFMALSMARLAELYPEEGSFYTYVSQWAGHTIGAFTTISYLVGLIIAMGLLTRITGSYLHIYFPNMSPQLLGIIALSIVVILNFAGAVISKIGQIILIMFTLLPLVLITGLCLTQLSWNNLFPFAPYGLSNIVGATKAVIFGFFGFESISSLFALVENPKKNVPRAIFLSVLFVGIIYMIFTLSLILAIPQSLFTSNAIPLSEVLIQQFNYPWLTHIINVAIIITIMGTLHSMIWSLSNLMIFCVKKIVSKTIPTNTAISLIGIAIGAACIIFSSINLLFSLTAIFVVFAYGMSILTLIIKPQRQTKREIIIAYLGFITAIIIILCAIHGVIQEFPKI